MKIKCLLIAALLVAAGCSKGVGDSLPKVSPEKMGMDSHKLCRVDSVINTGKTMLDIMDPSMYVACCVINEKAVPQFENRLYTVRVSKNSFVGSNVQKQSGNKGPDTTMRLFNLI